MPAIDDAMHNLLRAFINSCILIQRANEEQINRRGADKALATVWLELPRMDQDVRKTASQLLADPRRAESDPLEDESVWLEMVIDEIGSEADKEPKVDSTSTSEPLSESESWSTIARSTAWLAFCLQQAATYANDADYGSESFEQVQTALAAAEDFEKALAFAAITEASTHLESVDAEFAKQISSAYDRLLSVVGVSC